MKTQPYWIDTVKNSCQSCHALGSKVLLVCSSTSTHASTDADTMARDLRKLGVDAERHTERKSQATGRSQDPQ